MVDESIIGIIWRFGIARFGLVTSRPFLSVMASSQTVTDPSNDSATDDPASDGRSALRIHPIPPYYNVAHLQRLIQEDAGISEFAAVFKKPNRDIGFVTFESSEARDAALAKLRLLCRPNSTSLYSVQDAPFITESANQKRRREATVDRSLKRKLRNTGDPDHQTNLVKAVADVVTPWHAVPYSSQLRRKLAQLQRALSSIVSTLRKDYKAEASRYPDLDLKGVPRQAVSAHQHDHVTLAVTETDLVEAAESSPFMACPIDTIHGWATGRDGYRNKNDLTVGFDAEGAVSVGFIAGRKDGRLVVESAVDVIQLPPIASRIAADAEAFMRASCWPPFVKQGNDADATGVWRRVLIRSASGTSQVMVAITGDLSRLSSDEVAELKMSLATEFCPDRYSNEEIAGQHWRIETVVLQDYGGYGNVIPVDVPFELITGVGFIVEHLGRLQFQIQPASFFQVNTDGARLLYDIVGDWALSAASDTGSPVIVADVCCGTGTIGMTLHDRVAHVLGFELVETAVADARLNAKRNGLDRCEFFVGKAEETMSAVIAKSMAEAVPDSELLCIVDPPRAGLHKKVLKAIRTCAQIRRIVYVSCNPHSMSVDVASLMRPQSDKRPGRPFRPVRATLVDMFPHTDHCESIILLER